MTDKTTGDATEGGVRISRNAPCPCGSGKKYKMCCGAQIVAAERVAEEQRRAKMCGLRNPLRQKMFKRIGRRPVIHEPIAVRIQYFDGHAEDRVRFQCLSNNQWQISGWPQMPSGEKRPRECSFEVDDIEALAFARFLDDLPRVSLCKANLKGRVTGQLVKKTTVVLKGTACDGRYSWENDSPDCLREVESLALRLVARFHEICQCRLN